MVRNLVIDIGNSALKWAWVDSDGVLSAAGYGRHHGVSMLRLFDESWSESETPTAVWVASVVAPALTQQLIDWVERTWDLSARRVVAERAALGVENGYREPSQLGVDRWLALVAARARHRGPVCVADCGTAVTIDALDDNGRHLGGFILPGISLCRQALLEHTRIPWIEDAETGTRFGRDTAAAVALGGRRAVAGVIDYTIKHLPPSAEFPALLLTGSEAEQVGRILARSFTEVPHLVLEGLAHYASRSESTCAG